MKPSSCILTAIVLLGAGVFVSVNSTPRKSAVVGLIRSENPATAPARTVAAESCDNEQVAQGQLWETVATSARARAVTTMPVAATAFQDAQTQPVGSRFDMVLSPRIPVLDAEVLTRSVADDGTTILNLRIHGDPSGTLTLQENVASGFFLGQLYYDGLAVAYEFRSSKDGLVVTRHALDDLICAVVNTKEQRIEIAGYPPVDKDYQDDKGKKNNKNGEDELSVNTGNLLQEAKPTTVTTVAASSTGPALSVNDVAVVEGNSGTRSLLFTVKLTKADTKRIISVKYATSNGSATAGSDYTAASGTLTFPKGSTTQTLAVTVTGDSAVEPDETFTLNLTSPVNATLARATAVGTILNDDVAVIPPPPVLSVNDVAIIEGNSGTGSLLFTVQLSQADNQNIIAVNYATANGSAMAGSDYTAASGTLTFPMGSTTQTVAVTIMGDTAAETDETFSLNLTNPVNATIARATAVGTILNDDVAPEPSGAVPVHNSLPGAVAVAYLDMDGQNVSGQQWTGGGTIVARGISDTFTAEQMSEIWRRVTEDYAPFQINVTTDESVYLAAAPGHRVRCIITPDNEWYGAAGGVAYIGSFTWTGDTPCWVFSDQLGNSPRNIAESSSHEIGHTLGLSHDGRISPAEGYYYGQGSGEVGWAPIMGVGCYKSLVQWSEGEYLSANNTQDDLAIITSQNGFGYRIDDHANSAAGATPFTVSGNALFGSGIIETRDDVDVFSFVTQGGVVTFAVTGDATSQNLDILAEIKDAGGNMLAADNPDLLTDASVSASLPAGTYFLHVSGVGHGDYLADGYTDYGSIGQYVIIGTLP